MIEAHSDMTLIELIQAVEDGITDSGEQVADEEMRNIESMAIHIWQDLRQDEHWNDNDFEFSHRERVD
mgnify:CR=1 FL=1